MVWRLDRFRGPLGLARVTRGAWRTRAGLPACREGGGGCAARDGTCHRASKACHEADVGVREPRLGDSAPFRVPTAMGSFVPTASRLSASGRRARRCRGGAALPSPVLRTPKSPSCPLPAFPRLRGGRGAHGPRVSPAHPSPARPRNPRPPRERGAAHDVLRGWGPAAGGTAIFRTNGRKGEEKTQTPK